MSSTTTALAAAVARMDALSNWERRPRRRMRPSLDPIRDLLARLGRPHAGLSAVHVAGSKGKGSLAALVAAGLERGGKRTGLYASPHVERINERVRVGLEEVADGELAAALERVLDARRAAAEAGSAGREATWFDTITAAAFSVFARAGVDLVVAECGLGGRLDSTNVLAAEVCAITGVELEHTNVLGPTRARIAAEKSGILKPGATLVTALAEDDEAGAVVAARAAELGVPVLRPRDAGGATFAARNRALAELVLAELGRRGFGVSPGSLDAAAERAARLPGRMERLSARGVPVVLDGAHTPGSVEGCLAELGDDPGLPGRPVVILGLAAEKDLPGILKTLAARVDRVLCTSVGGALHRTPEEIEIEARAVGAATETAADPRVALEQALSFARRGGGWVLAIGSLYLVGELRPLLRWIHRPT